MYRERGRVNPPPPPLRVLLAADFPPTSPSTPTAARAPPESQVWDGPTRATSRRARARGGVLPPAPTLTLERSLRGRACRGWPRTLRSSTWAVIQRRASLPPRSASRPFNDVTKPTRLAAPSPRASLGRRTVCGRTEQRRPPVSKS